MFDALGSPQIQGLIALAAVVVAFLAWQMPRRTGSVYGSQQEHDRVTGADLDTTKKEEKLASSLGNADLESPHLLPLPRSISALQSKIRDWRFDRVTPKFVPEKRERLYDLWVTYEKYRLENYKISSSVSIDLPLHSRIVKYALLQTVYAVQIMRGQYSSDLCRPLASNFGRGFPITFQVRPSYASSDGSRKPNIEETDDIALLDINQDEYLFHVSMPSRVFGGALKFTVQANGPDECRVTLEQITFGPKRNFIIDVLNGLRKENEEEYGGPFLRRELEEFVLELFHVARCIGEFGCDPSLLGPLSWQRTYGYAGRVLFGSGDTDCTPELGRRFEERDQTFFVQKDLSKGTSADDPKNWYTSDVFATELVYVAKQHGELIRPTGNAAHRDDHVVLLKRDGQGAAPKLDPLTSYISDVILIADDGEPRPTGFFVYRGLNGGSLVYVVSDQPR